MAKSKDDMTAERFTWKDGDLMLVNPETGELERIGEPDPKRVKDAEKTVDEKDKE